MGLEEKRWIKEGQDTTLPKYQQKLKDLIGVDGVYEVVWDSFSSSLEALRNYEHQGLDRIQDVLSNICRDDLGKEAVKETFKKISLRNVADMAQKKIALNAGTLEVYMAWGAGSSDGYFSTGDLRREIEKLL